MDHSECVQVGEFTRTDVHHTHEGQKGWWLFPGEVPVSNKYTRVDAPVTERVGITALSGTQLQTAMLTLRTAGHHAAANVFQAELVRRAESGDPPR